MKLFHSLYCCGVSRNNSRNSESRQLNLNHALHPLTSANTQISSSTIPRSASSLSLQNQLPAISFLNSTELETSKITNEKVEEAGTMIPTATSSNSSVVSIVTLLSQVHNPSVHHTQSIHSETNECNNLKKDILSSVKSAPPSLLNYETASIHSNQQASSEFSLLDGILNDNRSLDSVIIPATIQDSVTCPDILKDLHENLYDLILADNNNLSLSENSSLENEAITQFPFDPTA